MSRPSPTWVAHFTHVRNLGQILEHGLEADSCLRRQHRQPTEIGSREIKQRRREKVVPVEPGGFVGDYVPFYFAPRSPMMYALNRGNYEYADGFDEVVYLVSTMERLTEIGRPWIVSDRNAALAVASFIGPDGPLDDHVDWPLMRQKVWRKTEDDPDRPERRAAECLVHDRVPWPAFTFIATKTQPTADRVRALLSAVSAPPEVAVRPGWYF